MDEFTPDDLAHMTRALELAERGRFTARPNPVVGCVVVKGGEVIGEGWHKRAGEPHAEVNALADAGNARDAAVYVTLEPCTHHGRTPPCVDALIKAKVGEVIVAALDPSDVVDGAGIAGMRAAGISVRQGLLADEAEAQNRGFIRRVKHQRPWVTLKVAASIDGATAMKNGESQWITSQDSRNDVQRLRAGSGAIVSGIGTVLADDPSLTVRDESIPADVLRDLAVNRDVNDVLVEAGPELAGSMIEAELVDELVIYQAPHIMGSETKPMFSTPALTELAERIELEIADVRRIGPDMKIIARVSGSRFEME